MCGRCCALSPITLFPHEVITIKNLAEKLGVDVKIRPSFTVYDELSGNNIALSYSMELTNGRCPFLSANNRCFLHTTHKPYVCRAFPYIPMYIKYYFDRNSKLAFYEVKYGVSTACRFISMFKHVLTTETVEDVFPYEFSVAKEMEKTRSLYMYALTILWRNDLVRLNSRVKKSSDVVNAYELIKSRIPLIFMPIKRI